MAWPSGLTLAGRDRRDPDPGISRSAPAGETPVSRLEAIPLADAELAQDRAIGAAAVPGLSGGSHHGGGRWQSYEQCVTVQADNIEQATGLAHQMVTRWGMSERLSMVQLAHRENPYLSGSNGYAGGSAGARPFSEETAEAIDAEVRKIISESHDEARRLLSAHRQQLDALVDALLVRRFNEQEDLRGHGAAASTGPGDLSCFRVSKVKSGLYGICATSVPAQTHPPVTAHTQPNPPR